MNNSKLYVDVIIPLPLKGLFTYSIDKDIDIGQRVIVQFGIRKLYTAIVYSIHNNKPKDYKVKSILAVLDEKPIVDSLQLRFWDWVSSYYMCNIGDVMAAALPSSLKLASESKIKLSSFFDGDLSGLSFNELDVVDFLTNNKEATIREISIILKIQNPMRLINQLIIKNIIQVREDLNEKYNAKKIKVLSLVKNISKTKSIRLTNKQKIFLDKFKKCTSLNPDKKCILQDFLKENGLSRSVLNALLTKNLILLHEEKVSRLKTEVLPKNKSNDLVEFQKIALDKIRQIFNEKKVCLLHGVTSSGKTELYIHLIEEQISKGKQVLYLLPEIALTTQIIKRLKSVFGNQVAVIHSNVNNSERVEIWKSLQKNSGVSIILGARSSIFLPYKNLGLIIVDEEHDSSFKQHQSIPRYHARDAAIYLSSIHKSNILLGSATPSLESWFNAKKDKFGLVTMNQRFSYIKMPEINIIDIRKANLKKKMKYQFSEEMVIYIRKTLDLGKQVILFQNRRGYSPMLICESCGFTPNCHRCDVSLTHHKWNNNLTCHYCGYSISIPTNCPACSSSELDDKGFGTEQLEESMNLLFPEYVTKRMDYDTTRKKNAYHNIINDFEEGKIDILIGTQMVTKGLDFDNVSLVCVMNADSLLNFSDFRAYERAYQLMSQVAGRAGRKGTIGKVLIQSYDVDNDIFCLLRCNDFDTFIKKQIIERKKFLYPPFNRLIMIILKHKNKEKLDESSKYFADLLRKSFGNRILGPEYPYISKIRNLYSKNILMKIEYKSSIVSAKNLLQSIIDNFNTHNKYSSIRITIDVDPL
tara:strand:- start:2299 stop:4728 length:2430 start_codon:yes stop_codon:yes gene_type:complete